MPYTNTKTARIEAVLQRVWARTWNVPEPLVGRVNVLPETNGVEVVQARLWRQNHIALWHVVGFNEPGVAIRALDLQAVVLGWQDSANNMFNGHERRLK